MNASEDTIENNTELYCSQNISCHLRECSTLKFANASVDFNFM